MASSTHDSANIALFADLARDWWDPDGRSRLLHRINPIRMSFIRDSACRHFHRDPHRRHSLAGLEVLDLGCGAGLVAEPLARMKAAVTAVDASPDLVAVARSHAEAQGLTIDYRSGDILELAKPLAGRFDLVTCLEVVEHVADVPGFLTALRQVIKPGGLLIFSTPNRTVMSWAVMILGAERITRSVPVGGHDWSQFLTPDELTQRLAESGFRVDELKGLSWSPGAGFHLSDQLDVNYLGSATAF